MGENWKKDRFWKLKGGEEIRIPRWKGYNEYLKIEERRKGET